MLVLMVNGQQRTITEDIAPDTPLLWVLRDHIGLVGAKFGCGIGACGACTVHLDGQAVRSCQVLASSVGTKAITTIEGLGTEGKLHPLQQAWIDYDVPQCGYCQAGQMMTAAALLKQHPQPSDAEILNAMTGNICRCGCYTRIIAAVHAASGQKTTAPMAESAFEGEPHVGG